jgi:hypothetical protein
MKTKLTKIIMSSLAVVGASVCLVAAMALGTSATARPESDPHGCDVHMVRGLYMWTFDGYTGDLTPKAIMQGTRFDGNGNTVNAFGTVNIGGFAFDVTGAVGTYTVNSDCTGTISVAGGGPTFNMYIGPGAQQLWTTQTGGGDGGLGVGTATRLPQ